MSTPSLYEMLTFSFSGELPLEQISERDQLILSVMDNMQRIINCRAGTLAHLAGLRSAGSQSDPSGDGCGYSWPDASDWKKHCCVMNHA